MDVAQTASFIQSMTYEAGLLECEEIPRTEGPVWILGKKYSALYDSDEIRADIASKLWFTYRKGFAPIGGTGPSQDTGWGCMLRCGQMMLAQALMLRHLGRDWRWDPDKYDPKYHEILRMFQDKKSACYSIQQIASMGVSEGKAVGQWFGPNTIAQVLRKLSVYDEWSSVSIHVAMDNTVILDDLETLCQLQCKGQHCNESSAKKARTEPEVNGTVNPPQAQHTNSHTGVTHCPSATQSSQPSTGTPSSSQTGTPSSSSSSQTGTPTSSQTGTPSSSSQTGTPSSSSHSSSSSQPHFMKRSPRKKPLCSQHWKPILLIIPLRLGLSEINPVYVNALKSCLTIKQSVGIVGGKPNHAHWFIGHVEDELVYLDPHIVQPIVDLTLTGETDESFHCPCASRLNIAHLDPSIALGYYCESADDLYDWYENVKSKVLGGERTPMFEIYQHRPRHWPPFQPYTGENVPDPAMCSSEERLYDTDEEFELI